MQRGWGKPFLGCKVGGRGVATKTTYGILSLTVWVTGNVMAVEGWYEGLVIHWLKKSEIRKTSGQNGSVHSHPEELQQPTLEWRLENNRSKSKWLLWMMILWSPNSSQQLWQPRGQGANILRWNGRNYMSIKPVKNQFQFKKKGLKSWVGGKDGPWLCHYRDEVHPTSGEARLSGKAKDSRHGQYSWGSRNPAKELGGSPLRGMQLLRAQEKLMEENLLIFLRWWS